MTARERANRAVQNVFIGMDATLSINMDAMDIPRHIAVEMIMHYALGVAKANHLTEEEIHSFVAKHYDCTTTNGVAEATALGTEPEAMA